MTTWSNAAPPDDGAPWPAPRGGQWPTAAAPAPTPADDAPWPTAVPAPRWPQSAVPTQLGHALAPPSAPFSVHPSGPPTFVPRGPVPLRPAPAGPGTPRREVAGWVPGVVLGLDVLLAVPFVVVLASGGDVLVPAGLLLLVLASAGSAVAALVTGRRAFADAAGGLDLAALLAVSGLGIASALDGSAVGAQQAAVLGGLAAAVLVVAVSALHTPAPAWPGSAPPRSSVPRPLAWLAAVLAVCCALAPVGADLVTTGTSPTPGPGPLPPGPVSVLTPVSADASCATTGTDSAGTPFRYQPVNAFDSDPESAWRCEGAGYGQWLRADFGTPVTITEVGLVPGYDKVDPYDGTDRFAQSPRILGATWTFDDGTVVSQSFDTSPTTGRDLQTMSVPPVRTSSVLLTVTTTVPGSTVGDQGPVTKTGTSTVRLVGAR
ncbi:discoidin domain-containing protein [Actinomycetospora sp. CA-101289]|uniref:discoidin domain-containing protein n=1 Tax=Actinomycetospora sp. CA-101289 TaxID=3239893 RepID=UPI003D9639F7